MGDRLVGSRCRESRGSIGAESWLVEIASSGNARGAKEDNDLSKKIIVNIRNPNVPNALFHIYLKNRKRTLEYIFVFCVDLICMF